MSRTLPHLGGVGFSQHQHGLYIEDFTPAKNTKTMVYRDSQAPREFLANFFWKH